MRAPAQRPRPTAGALALAVLVAATGLNVGAQPAAPLATSSSQPAPVSAARAPLLGLTDVYRLAVQNDATFRAAGFDLDSVREAVPQARAALLPAVGFTASTSEVEGWRKARNQLNQDTRVRLDYGAPQASLQVRVPILSLIHI